MCFCCCSLPLAYLVNKDIDNVSKCLSTSEGGFCPGDFQGDHSPGKPGKVREFQSGQGKWKKSGEVFFSSSKYSKTRFSAGLRPGPRWRSLQRSLDSLVGWGGEHYPLPPAVATPTVKKLTIWPHPVFH